MDVTPPMCAIRDAMLMRQLCRETPEEIEFLRCGCKTPLQPEHKNESDNARRMEQDRLIRVIRHPRFIPVSQHRHRFIEAMYVCSGTITHIINGKPVVLEPGDFLMLNQYTSHEILAAGESDIAVTFMIQPRFFEDTYELAAKRNVLSDFIVDLLRQEVNCNQYLHYKTYHHLPISHLIEILLCSFFPFEDEWNEQMIPAEDSLVKTLMFLVFLYLSRDLSALSCDSPMNFEQIMMTTVMNYIEKSYQTATLTELAEILNQSISSLSRQIKLVSGSTFKELLQAKRFQRAVTLLGETNLAVSDIALAVGYENSSYFYRRFREIYGISPKVYRENAEK